LLVTSDFFLCWCVGLLFNNLGNSKFNRFTVSRDGELLLFSVGPLEDVSSSRDSEEESVKNSESPWKRGNGDK
jgi:hypothetical protein